MGISLYKGRNMEPFVKIVDSYVAKHIPNYDVSMFTAQSDFEQAKFVMNMIRTNDPVPAVRQLQKSESCSQIFTSVGNTYLALHNVSHALEYFNKAIMLAPANSLPYIEGLQKRSECLISMGFHDKALIRVEQALKCSGIKVYNKKPMRQMKICEELAGSSRSSAVGSCLNDLLPLNRSEYLTSASDKVAMPTDASVGRLLKATADIRTGEVIMIEEPYATLIKQKFSSTHCWNCTKYCEDLHPCTNCCDAMFCSQNCLEEAKKYHDFECPIMYQLIYELGVPELYLLALHMFLIATENGTKLNELKKKVGNIDAELKNSMTYDSNDFIRIYNLKYHPTMKSANFYFYFKFLAGIIISALSKRTNLFEDVSSDLQEFACSLLLRFLLIAECNAQSVTAMGPLNGDLLAVGDAIFATFSLFNHSCDPNVERHILNQSLVVRATKYINAGEELNVSYKSNFAFESFSSRQAKLAQYNFICKCKACEQQWPMYPYQPSTLPELKKPMDSMALSRFSDLCNDFTDAFKFEWKDEDLQLINNVTFTPKIMNLLCEFIDMMTEYFDIPHQRLTEALKLMKIGINRVPGFQRSFGATEDTDAAALLNE